MLRWYWRGGCGGGEAGGSRGFAIDDDDGSDEEVSALGMLGVCEEEGEEYDGRFGIKVWDRKSRLGSAPPPPAAGELGFCGGLKVDTPEPHLRPSPGP